MVLFEALCLLQLLTISISLETFSAYRMLQYEKNQRPFGSSSSTINDLIISPIFGDHDLGRNIGVISISNLTLQLLQTLTSRRCQSLLIILPSNNDNSSNFIYTDSFYLKFQEIEHYLLTNSFDFSIFFTFNDAAIINKLLSTTNDLFNIYGNKDIDYWEIETRKHAQNQLMSPFSMHDLYQLSASEISQPITNVKYTNIFGKITNNINTKYIVITANHDSFGIVPNIAFGVNDNGSGITSIMCLMNLFYKLFEKNKANLQEKYNLLFLLTAGGYTNYKGSTKWIEDNKIKQFVQNIELVLCIDSIGIGESLYLHTTPAFLDDENVFKDIAKQMGINLFVNNLSIETDTRLNGWNHEEFSRNKINAVTISGKGEKYLTWNGTSILDNIKRIKLKMLYRNIEYLANVLFAVVYGAEGAGSVRNNDVNVNERYMNNYVNYLNQMPRFGPYHYKSSYLKKLKNDFQLNCHEWNVQQYYENELYEKYYSTDVVSINVYNVTPYIFDFMFMVVTLMYLFVFYVVIHRPKNIREFVAIFLTD